MSKPKQPQSVTGDPEQLLRVDTLERVLGVSQSYIYKLMKAGQFPKSVRIGPRAVAWRAGDVRQFIQSLKNNA
ncbi:helix-turn-helix transcriptional regulator [Silvimonas amylolytica]|uniref:Transcriptional regulator, AlpA family n=1 Tax=Silvimonas amylolytica TaxID=449663 RepID=A0ABQ2PSR8_9NEIS|nr:AlpA family phage regulatory protein [Silvimonas amylolytica]GGP28314.1 hypothetical protein GCM10010971_41330 [Silvimonas amylolytica]